VRQAEKTLDKSSNLCYIVSRYKLYIDNIYTMSQEENMPRGRRRHGGCGQGRFAGGTIAVSWNLFYFYCCTVATATAMSWSAGRKVKVGLTENSGIEHGTEKGGESHACF
jgi:hypothetical protein